MDTEYINTLIEAINNCSNEAQNVRRAAEEKIEELVQRVDFLRYALYLLSQGTVSNGQKYVPAALLLNPLSFSQIRVFLAVLTKNHIKKFWTGSTDAVAIDDQIKQEIRQSIIPIMVQSDKNVSKLISDAIAIIAESDYPTLWESLFIDLKNSIQIENLDVLVRILDCAQCITRKFYGKDDTDENLLPVRCCLDTFGIYMYDIWNSLTQKLQNTTDVHGLNCINECLAYLTGIFSSLCWFSLPDIFEDKISEWMNAFMAIMNQDPLTMNPAIDVDPIDQLKANIIEILSLLPYKSDDVYRDYFNQISTIIWNILQNKSYLEDSSHRSIYVNGLKFINAMFKFPRESKENMERLVQDLFENLLIPILSFTEEREAAFEDTPYEYGEGTDSVEQACHTLLYTLQTNYLPTLIQLFNTYLKKSNDLYLADRSQGWVSREVMIVLYMYIHCGFQTAMKGTRKMVSAGVDLNSFVTDILLPDLQAPEGQIPAPLLAREIWFCLYFRHLITKTVQYSVFSTFLHLLPFKDPVLHTLAAIAIDKYLYLKDSVLGQPLFNSSNLSSSITELLTVLFAYINEPTVSILHHYFLKALATVIIISKQDIQPYLKAILDSLCSLLNAYSKNNDLYPLFFVHYLFEALAALIKVSVTTNAVTVDNYYQYLFEPLSTMLNSNSNDILSYVLQILAYLLEIDTATQLREGYAQLFPQLLNPALWSVKGNLKPLIRFITAYCHQGQSLVISSILPLLNIFRDLLLKNAFRYESLELLESLIVYLPHDCYKNYLNIIYQLLFGQLQRVKVAKYTNHVLYILAVLSGLYGCESTSTFLLNMLKPEGFMNMMFLLVKHTVYVSDELMMKAIIVGICRMIYEDPFFKTSEATQLNITILCSLINMVENKSSESLTFSPIDPTNEDGEDEFESLKSFNAYHALSIAAAPQKDPFSTYYSFNDTLIGTIKMICTPLQSNLMPMLEQVCPAITEMNKDKVAAYIQASLHS